MQGSKCEMKYLTATERNLLNSFPVLSAEELEKVNDLYSHYVFINNKPDGWEVSTSCCHVDRRFYALLRETETPEEYELFHSSHNEEGVCPFCGKPVTFKNVGRCKSFKKLREEHRVAFWHCTDNTVYVQCYWTQKHFNQFGLACEPRYYVSIAYAFQPGCATMFWQESYNWYVKQERVSVGKKIALYEPFAKGGYFAPGYEYWYTDIGRKTALSESFLKYSCLEDFEIRDRQHPCQHRSPMKYLDLYCVYPHAVEMLMKNGMMRAVSDFVFYGKKNAAAIKWDERDPRLAFGLDGQELRTFMELPQRDVELVAFYKRAKKRNWKMSFRELYDLKSDISPTDLKSFFTTCQNARTTPRKFFNYLDKYVSKCSHGGGFNNISSVYNYWLDYVYAADEIGLDTKNPLVMFPKNLKRAHDDATGIHNHRLEMERRIKAAELKRKWDEDDWCLNMGNRIIEAAQKQKAQIEKNNREARYSYSDGEFLIRPANDGDEVIAEGRALEHCVGGYALRHDEGKLTICFMRRCSEPDKPFITIEMQGKTLRQIHGYKNERLKDGSFAPDPKIQYRAFLDPWLLWVTNGSKRDENGNPIMLKKKSKKESKVA